MQDPMREARLKRFAVDTPKTSSASTASSRKRAEPPDAAVSSTSLFRMGFDTEAVGRALVKTRGDAFQALELLRPEKVVDEAEHEPDDEDLALALQMSLEPSAATASASQSIDCAGSAASISTVAHRGAATNPHWDPPRYVPAEGAEALRVVGGRTLSLVEFVEVRDGAYGWQSASAFLDTGNQHMTIVDTHFARRHAIYQPSEAAAIFGGEPTGSGLGQAEAWTTVHGVVPGASSRAPVVTIALKIRGEEMIIRAIVSEMQGHDLLLGVDVLERLFRAGFRIGAGSV